ncbi:putative translaldolase [Glycocaulis alkaliphilus]|uniref:Probable transaldolase n=1 Tax=Glycocaulis alkaliphilus TaxID=1434191 RepID=A0A3T0EC46_9PROT|nr:fructose-6-phosphate aldolase [Glycocaulis alkaliphilus]AZU04864.1 putative translaldolase [Glycocaulis alkaliphilus]GGB67086.1 putative transaldolase [Glycocaulis alkaliphilus]
MQLFLDTADISQITARMEGGLVDGITTNPSLIAKSGADIIERIAEICAVVPGPVSAEVVATDVDGMLEEGRRLRAIADNVVVKLPLTTDGLKACRTFANEGIPTNVTLCFSLNQALLAAKAGATFVSPFVGRIDDMGGDGLGLLEAIREVYDQYGYETGILAASLRSVTHVEMAARIGCDAATLPPGIFDALVTHPLTDSGLKAFLDDWKKTGRSGLSQG